MRGILFLFVAILAFGCTQPDGAGNETNISVVQNCTGPVCGSDGATYLTDCDAALANATIAHSGECAPPPVEENCTETDAGLDKAVAGSAAKGNESYDDYCIDASQLAEYACVDNTVQLATIACAANEACDAGACMPKPEENATPPVVIGCEGPLEADMMAAGTTVANGTQYNDTCVDYRTVKDYYCKGADLQAINNQCPSGHMCYNGRCEYQSFQCAETDSGNDTSQRGKTTVTKGFHVSFEEIDECIDQGLLREHYCLANGTAETQEMLCPSGTKCMAGRCIPGDCSETDGGRDILKWGVTTYKDDEEEDYCVSRHDLIEYYCYGDEIRSDRVACGKGYICNEDTHKCVEGSIS